MNNVKTCETCLYCQPQDGETDECRYYHPVIAAHLIHGAGNELTSCMLKQNANLFPMALLKDITCSAYQENSQMKEICAQ